MRWLLRPIVLVPVILVLVPLLAIVVLLTAAFRGSPGACGGDDPPTIDPALALAYDERWLGFNATLTSGLPASLSVSDDEATSRAWLFLLETGGPAKDVRICFVEEGADVSGTLSTPFGPDVDVRVKGTVDLSGTHPRADISSIDVGGVPGFAMRPFRGLVTRIIDEQMERIVVDHRLTVDTQDGSATISGEP